MDNSKIHRLPKNGATTVTLAVPGRAPVLRGVSIRRSPEDCDRAVAVAGLAPSVGAQPATRGIHAFT